MPYEPPPHYSDFMQDGPIWRKWIAGLWRYSEESGTFTPTYGSATTAPDSITYDQQDGFYVRRGAILHVWFRLGTDAVTIGGGTGNLTVEGFPRPNNMGFSAEGLVFGQSFTNNPARAFVSDDTTRALLDQADGTNIVVGDLATGANSNRIRGYIAYPVEV